MKPSQHGHGRKDDEYESEDEEELQRKAEAKAHLASVAKLEITNKSAASKDNTGGAAEGSVLKMEMPADATLGQLFQALQEKEV